MSEALAMPVSRFQIAPEDDLRAQAYRLLARFLTAPPAQSDLDAGASLAGNDGALGKAVSRFAGECAKADPASLADDYQTLFIGLGRGELVPYGSYYLTGFLQEKPLAKLRQDMDRLGLAREPATKEPEDHIASVLEMMAGFIDGRFSAPLVLVEQRRFFDVHVGSWAGHFFRDLAANDASALYAALGRLGGVFLEIEDEAFRMD